MGNQIVDAVVEQYNSTNPGSFSKNTLKQMREHIKNITERFLNGKEVPKTEIDALILDYIKVSNAAKKAWALTPIRKRDIQKFFNEIDTLVTRVSGDLCDKDKFTLLPNGNYIEIDLE
jgi:hypothetical protein